MAKCPKCKKKLEILIYEEDVCGKFMIPVGIMMTMDQLVFVKENNKPYYNPKSGNGLSYSCPECYAHIADCEEDAIKFLTK
jgi:hypothetical protein